MTIYIGGAAAMFVCLAFVLAVPDVGAIVNMAWPRSPQDPWYSNYGMLVATAVAKKL